MTYLVSIDLLCFQEKQLAVVRDIVTTEKNLRDETREKLAMISSAGRYSKSNYDSPGNYLEPISELNSTGSMLASFDITNDRTEDELELSMVRSSRAARMKRVSDQINMPAGDSAKRRRSSRDVSSFSSVQLIHCRNLTKCSFGSSRTESTREITNV